MSSTLAAFAHRDYRLLWYGLVTSNVGTWMQAFAQGWLVIEIAGAEGSPQLAPLYLGFVNLARGAAGLVCGLSAGIAADRFDRRALLTWVQMAQLVFSAALALYTIFANATILGLVLLGALNAAAQAFDGPTRQAIIPRIVPRRDLMSAIGLLQMAWQGSGIVGPLVGGLLIGPIGAGGVLLIKALFHLPLIAISRMLSPQPVTPTSSGFRPLADLAESIRFVVKDPILCWTMLISASGFLLVRSNTGLLPAFTEQVFRAGPRELAWLLAASGLGAVAGAAFLAPLGNLPRRGLMLGGSAGAAGMLLVLFALQREVLPAAVLTGLGSGAWMVTAGVTLTLLQTRSPDALRGRVMSLQNVCLTGINPLGVMLVGALATLIGLVDASAIAGVAFVLVCAFALLRTRTLRQLRVVHGDEL